MIASLYHSMVSMCHCRPGDEDFEIASTLGFCRLLFDHLRKLGKEPIVVDAEDMLWRTGDLEETLCSRFGLAGGVIRDTWDPVPEEQNPTNPVLREWTKTIYESSGIERPAQKVCQQDRESSTERDFDR